MTKVIKGKGMTLVEVIIALGIIALVIAGILEIFVNSTALKDFNRQYEIANQAAIYQIEDLKSTDFDEILTKYSWTGSNPKYRTFSVSELPNGTGTIELNQSTGVVMYNLKVTVTWTGRAGQRSHTTNTMLTR